MSCLILTPEIRELAKKFPNEIEQSILNLVGMWQEKNKKSIEDTPSGSELNAFIQELRRPKGKGVETVFSTSGNNSYPSRTRENANWSDITIALAQDFNTAGEKLTKNAAGNKYVSFTLAAESNDASEIAENLYNQIRAKGKTDNLKINIAGNGIYSMKQSQSYYNDLMTFILSKLQDMGVTISEIRSGGQTGIDEAGIIAAQRLGIPNEVHSTANFMFRDKSGKDISDEQAFKNRFLSSISSRPEAVPSKWARTAENGYEVSTRGDKRFSALVATFKKGTVIDGVDVGGRTIEDVYQSVIKKSGKGKAPSVDSIINLDRVEENGEPSWIKEELDNRLPTDLWHKLYGVYGGNYEAIGAPIPEITKADREDFSYYIGYLPLWQEWARQNPQLIDELRVKAQGRTLTDQFANTRVSQARALSEILGGPEAQTVEERPSDAFDTPRITTVEEQQKVDLLFDPRTRRDRVTLIARFFSNEIDTALKEEEEALKRKRDDTETQEEREDYQSQLAALDRFTIIKRLTPAGIFRRVANIFTSYVNDTEEGRVQQELNKINANENALIEAGEIDESERFSDEEKLEAAKKKAAYKLQEYKKIVDDPYVYKALAEEASTLLIATEGIRVDPNYIAPADANLNDDDPDGNSEVDNEAEDWKQEEAYKDGWMTNFRQVSSHESLSQAVRAVIRKVPKLDYEGMYEEDDLGFTRYLDADYVHATLIDKLRNMINSDDMIPLLQNLEKIKPWVGQITELLQEDETLFSQFYQDFRKDFMPYWIQKKKMMPDGTFKMETIAINKPEGVYYLLDAWRDNYENGVQLDDDSVYEKNGEINKDNVAKGLQWTETLNNMFQNLDTESRLQLLEREDVWNTIMKLLHMLGIDANPSVLKTALTDIKTAPGITFTDPIMLLLPQLNVIFSGIKKGEVKSETREDGTEKRGDLINTFGSAYNMIASMMAEVTEDAIESSVRENDKSYYSHVTPNYLGKLIKNLKNVMNDKERFEQFMQTEFKDYEWFFKDGHWRNDWLRQLAESDELRRGLNHKVVLNSDKVDYTNWDDLDYTLALLTEYWGDPDSAKSSIKYAWYHVPILSDSPSAEFIRFRKYTTGDVLDENGKKRTYDDVILDKLVDLVNQEYDRIMLVRERDEAYQSGDKSVEPIANYDIVRKKDGSIKSIGGAEFKFLPALNNLRYDNGETFIDRLSRLKSKGTGAELRNFLRTTLNDMMEDGFEQTYRDWMRAGLLDELPNGKYKYLPFEGQSKQNAITAKALIKAKDALGSLWNTNMELMLRAYNNNSAFDSREANNLMEQIKNLLTDKATRGEMELKDAQSISRSLFVKNNAKDALREYYWNSKLATSQIIQLTTTDLAFYKNLEDFQKRYKEIHAPALRLNTKATYKGERIGRDWERTIYLKDDEIVSSVLEDIKTVLDERVRRNEMTKIDRDNIISKFRNVNVADAQAYRSLSSYRAILGMSGQWTDDMEQAYNNFKNGDWNIKDFNIIWQTKKPYVYTQVNNNSGIEGHTGIKTPVQHKNSEFLLLAMHELIAGPLGRSGKLKAINKFMEDNQIDVVQFESTTKVGKQGVINLNTKLNMTSEEKAELDTKLNNGEISKDEYDKIIEENTVPITSYEDTMAVLKDTTGIGFGNENPNVVHKVSYEDYGIQTATPEHAIDAVQLVGTQIRKLITADISDDTIIEVNGKKMTKKEWLDLYNAINTENILQAFADVDKIFKDPKKVEEILLEEIRGNQRYGMDMMRACTLDENNNFNIPLFDPVQSQRVQTLLNSIIKSRITKQKIRGGALIQVSDYGLTDQLNIVFKDKNGNPLNYELYKKKHHNATRESYEEFVKNAQKEGELSIMYLECYMPAYSREFYEPLMDSNTHQLDVTKLPEDLRKLIGYRV